MAGAKHIVVASALLMGALMNGGLRSETIPPLDAVKVANLSAAIFVTAPTGDYDRLFIVRQSGQINILKLDPAAPLPAITTFLDISTGHNLRAGGEQGLLGMAFDPNYLTSGNAGEGKFYLDFTVIGGLWQNGTTHISQFQVDPMNTNVALTTEKLLAMPLPSPSPPTPLTFDHPQSNHNAGWIGFSPRGGDDYNLYISTGDGGNSYDQDPTSTPTPTPPGHIEPGGNAQNNTTLLGKMLRVHVDPATATYTIPANNPFANSTPAPSPSPSIRKEIWAYGLRNPFRNSFDRLTGRMYIADVGQNTREEVDAQEPTNPGGGENFGWRLREGTIQTPASVGGTPPPGNVDPILDYDRAVGGTVIGGCVYRGKQIPGLRGWYVFGDYLAHKIFVMRYDGTNVSDFQEITSQLFPTANNETLSALSSFGEDANGELYITDVGSGNVFKIVPVTPNIVISSVTIDALTGDFVVQGIGVPFTTVRIEATQDLTQSFAPLTTAHVAGDGTFTLRDTSHLGMRFYDVKYP